MKYSGGTGIPGNAGLPWMQVTVLAVDGGRATCLDQFGNQRVVPVGTRRGNGPKPRVGESWAIDRTLGFWTFASVLTSKPNIISGSSAGVPALQSLLEELETVGLIRVDRNESGSALENSTSTWASDWTSVPQSALQHYWLSSDLQYRKIVSGLVLLRGTLTPTPPPGPPVTPLPSVAYTLPIQCRPSRTTTLWGISGPLTVSTNGDLTLNAQRTLDQAFFLAEP